MTRLKYLSTPVLADLRKNISQNLHRYLEDGFIDLIDQNGWSMELERVQYDQNAFSQLSCDVEESNAEVRNSLLVYQAFEGMNAALATEERIWTRLTHVECIDYARKRWPLKSIEKSRGGLLSGLVKKGVSDEERQKIRLANIKQVEKHYFAGGRTGYRDDNAVSRLWWNAYVAHLIDPVDPTGILEEILKTADIRQGLIERPLLSNRIFLMRGIVDCMRAHPEITQTASVFRKFLVSINFHGGGVLFEGLSGPELSSFLDSCRLEALDGDSKKIRAA